jgi:hypothetical protein
MSFLDRLFRRALVPSTTRSELPRTGPTTAREAWELARPEALALDPGARLLLVTSGTDLQADGRSLTWEFLLALPARQARVLVSLAPPESAADPDRAPLELTRRVTRSAERDEPRALPFAFRDSPEVVLELARAGVDFVAGPTDMKLEGRVLPSGLAAWVTFTRQGERTVAFESRA